MRLLGEMTDSRAGAGIYRMNLAHVVAMKVRMSSSNTKIGLVIGTQEQL